jgi:hypothetical protein
VQRIVILQELNPYPFLRLRLNPEVFDKNTTPFYKTSKCRLNSEI